MAQVMSKADMQLTKLYSTLVGDKEIADRVYNAIAEEYTLTLEMFLKVTEQEHLLAETPRWSDRYAVDSPIWCH